VLDTGGLIAFDRGNRQVAALVDAARRRRDPVITSSGCVAQAWRGSGSPQAPLADLLRGAVEVGLDQGMSRIAGGLCGTTRTNDVVDAHVALVARGGDVVLTTDVNDLRRLIRARDIHAEILLC
jgi:hypothetical protein